MMMMMMMIFNVDKLRRVDEPLQNNLRKFTAVERFRKYVLNSLDNIIISSHDCKFRLYNGHINGLLIQSSHNYNYQ